MPESAHDSMVNIDTLFGVQTSDVASWSNDATTALARVTAIVRANVRNVLFVSNRTCVQNAFVIFPNVKRTCKHSNA